jgi:hypothetical protein
MTFRPGNRDYGRKIIERTPQPKDFQLGKHLTTVKSAPYGCPVCIRSKKIGTHRMDVFENGVRWPCGCIVDLPPMHDGRGKLCQWCNPTLTTVRGFRWELVA